MVTYVTLEMLCGKCGLIMPFTLWKKENPFQKGGRALLTSKRKTIGVFINRTGYFFENTVYRMVQEMGRKYNYNIIVFATLGHRNSANYYDELEKAMFTFAPVEELDGLLITPDTYQMEGFHEKLFEMINTRATCPVVSIRDHRAPCDRVSTDETDAIRPLLKHLLDDHGYRRVHFLAGFKGHPDSEARLRCYREEMEAHGLPLPENAVYYGSMWRSGGPEACDFFCPPGQPLPEAIVCANDYMAQAIIEELHNRNIDVPGQICVTGFDNVEYNAAFSVPLTTVEQDYEGMITNAFECLKMRMAERDAGLEPAPQMVIGQPVKLIKRKSCGCQWLEDKDASQERLLADSLQMQRIRVRETSQMYFSIDMNASNTMEEMHNTIMRKRSDVPELRDFYLCCFETKPGTGETDGYAENLTDHATLVSAIRDHEELGMPMDRFHRSKLLPDWVWDSDEPQSFFARLLHQRDSIYGYCMIRYDEGHIPSIFFHQWNVTVSSALRHLFNQQKLQRLYDERRLSSITDPLTGLYNRRGLEELVAPTWERRCQLGEYATILAYDMDNLKPTNDTYGHEAGDDALQRVAETLRRLDWEGAVSARIGGDEFLVFLPRCDEESAQQVAAAVETGLAKLNEEKGTPYGADMSGGSYTIRLMPGITLEKCIRESDERMYAVKRQRKQRERCHCD